MASERDASVDRIIAFSDGVVAIAITLLILPLTDIEPAEGANLANVAADNAGELLGFAVSFALCSPSRRSTFSSPTTSPGTPSSPMARQRLKAANMP